MGSVMSLYYGDDIVWDNKTIRQKYLVNKQIEDSDKIKLRCIEAHKFYGELQDQFQTIKKKNKKSKK